MKSSATASAPTLTPDTVLERRPGVDCAVQLRESSSAILTAWNEVTGPRSLAPVLVFVRDHRRFRVSHLPHPDAASRLILARKLVASGFLRPAPDPRDGSADLPERLVADPVDPAKGSLVVIGSGIKSVAHLTLEAKGWLDASDIVFYLLSDPATESWIQENYPHSIDLARLYSVHLQRSSVYDAMVEEMMSAVRRGYKVCSIFYGHPGVFVTPTHKAVEAARAEGYPARMLPGVSASGCLYADVGFNPSEAGLQCFEATDLMVYRRPLHPENNVVIWQIGLVGNPTSLDDASKLPLLIEYLEQFYDLDCEVVHYQGSVFTGCEPVVERLPLRELGQGARVTNMSTLYIPPQRTPELDMDMVRRLGLLAEPTPAKEEAPARVVEPTPYEPTPAGSPLARLLVEVGVDPTRLLELERDPEAVALRAGLSDDERGALLTRMPGRIWAAVKNHSLIEEAAATAS